MALSSNYRTGDLKMVNIVRYLLLLPFGILAWASGYLCRFSRFFIRIVAVMGIALMLHTLVWPWVYLRITDNFISSASIFEAAMTLADGGMAYAEQSQSVYPAEAQGQNPNSSVLLDADGTPLGAQGKYYPAELNPILGHSVFMTPLDCVSKYGQPFCECGTLQDGTEFCYYRRPAAGYYSSIEACEQVWGAGYCVCPSADRCMLYESAMVSTPLQCQGQIYFFSGEKMECRKAGILSMGEDCCLDNKPSDSSCSFENIADELGMDDLAMTAVSLGLKVADLAGYSLQDYIIQEVSYVIAENILKEGGMSAIMNSLTSLVSSSGAELIQTTATNYVASTAMATETIVATLAPMISTMISVAGWIYFAYQVYNMVQSMQECTAGEMILGCKRAKGVCHKVGSRCKVKVFDSCLQSMGVYCCFNTKLARIINEQGRKQIGKSWGSAKKPNCKGFLMDEFAKIDLSNIDFSEYSGDLVREMNPNVQDKIDSAIKRLGDNF
jgi:hypothetical protein